MDLPSIKLAIASGWKKSNKSICSASSRPVVQRMLIVLTVLVAFAIVSSVSSRATFGNTGYKAPKLSVNPTFSIYLPLIAKGCAFPSAPFNPTSGALRGVFEGGLPGDSGRTRLGTFDAKTSLRHYLINFYWTLESEGVTNGSPSIDSFARQVWTSNRMPVLHIRTQAFVDNAMGLNGVAVTRLSEFADWLTNAYTGQIAISLFPEMNLIPAPYCPSNWDAATCIRVFKTAFQFASNKLHSAAPNRVHIGLDYNMRWLAASNGTIGWRYSDWQVPRANYSWVGYNIFAHACKNGTRETTDPWFLKAALREPGNDFYQAFCANGTCGSPCIIAETAASDSCSSGYQSWWIDRFMIGSDASQPYLNLHLPDIKGYVWFNQNNAQVPDSWEENWQIQDQNIAHYSTVLGNSYFKDAP